MLKRAACVLVAVAAFGSPARAQAPAQAPAGFRALFVDLGHEMRGLRSRGTLVTLGVGGALALAVHPADRTLTSRATGSLALDEVLDPGESGGSGWAQGGAALAAYLVGRASHRPRLQAVGADLVQAQIVTAGLTQGVKFAVGRKRPDDGRYSVPSGHTSATFANATVLQRHFGWKVGVPAYAAATYVAASRLQENRHYASDVIFGAAIGVVAGRTVTVGRGRAAFAVSPIAVSGGGGVQFVATGLR
jgi:membrane-associated phospholipid phosphatase